MIEDLDRQLKRIKNLLNLASDYAQRAKANMYLPPIWRCISAPFTSLPGTFLDRTIRHG